MKEHEKTAIGKVEKLTAELERNPAVLAFRAKEAAEILKKRKEAAAKIENLQLDMEATQVIAGEINDLQNQLDVIEHERAEILARISRKKIFLNQERFGIEGMMRVEQEILFSSYGPEIDDALIFFRNKLDWLREPGRVTTTKNGSQTDIFAMTKTAKIESNYQAVVSAMRYCQNAICTLEKMKLIPEVDLPRIENLKKDIPKIDVFNEFSDEKDISHDEPRPGYRKAIMEATGNFLDYSIAKLTEKAQKALKPKYAR
jgi:hypothetical protein